MKKFNIQKFRELSQKVNAFEITYWEIKTKEQEQKFINLYPEYK